MEEVLQLKDAVTEEAGVMYTLKKSNEKCVSMTGVPAFKGVKQVWKGSLIGLDIGKYY